MENRLPCTHATATCGAAWQPERTDRSRQQRASYPTGRRMSWMGASFICILAVLLLQSVTVITAKQSARRGSHAQIPSLQDGHDNAADLGSPPLQAYHTSRKERTLAILIDRGSFRSRALRQLAMRLRSFLDATVLADKPDGENSGTSNRHSTSDEAFTRFVLLPFSHSGVSLAMDTQHGSELVSAVSGLRHVTRDSDLCETFSFRALWSAIASSPVTNDSVLIVATDGHPKDPAAWTIIQDQAKKKRAMIHFIMTGDCTMLESWSLDERYFRLAESTGGQVVVTQRWQKAVNIFDALLKQLIGPAVQLFRRQMLLSEKGQTFHVNIDSDVQNVTAILACSEPLISPVLNVKAGRFDSLFRVKYLILANAVIATMQPPYPKTLTLFAEARQITEVCSLSVSATSEVNVDFSYVGGSPFATGSVVQEDIVEDLQLANYPRVAAGQDAFIATRTGSFYQVEFVDVLRENGTVLSTLRTASSVGSTKEGGNELFPAVKLPFEPYRLRFRGSTNRGSTFTRYSLQSQQARSAMTANGSDSPNDMTYNERLLPTSKVLRLAGDTVTLSCPVIGNEGVQWSRQDARPVLGTEGRVQLESTRLIVSNAIIMDTAIYICKSAGQTHRILLTIYDPPRIEPSTKLIRRVGECLELECKTAGDPQPRVKWFLNDTLLQGDEFAPVLANGSLRLCRVNEYFAGTYTCRTTLPALGARSIVVSQQTLRDLFRDILLNLEGEGQVPTTPPPAPMSTHTLDKEGKPIFSVLSGSVMVVGTCVQVRCEPLGGVQDCLTVWLRDGEIATNYPGTTVFTNGTLQVCEPDIKGKGVYSCLLANNFGTVRKDTVLNTQVLISATAKFFNTNLPVRQEPGNQPSPWDHQSDIDNLQNIIGGSESPPPNSHSPLSDQGHEAIEALPEATLPNDAPPLRGLESKHHTDDHTTHYNSKQRDLYVLDKNAAVEAETRPTHTTPSQYQAVLDVEIPTQPLFSLSDHNSIGMRTSPPESLSIKNGESITERGKPSDESNMDLDKDAEAIVEAIPVEDTSPRNRRPAAGEAIFAEPRPLSPAHITSPFIQVSARGLCLHLSCPFTASPEGKLRWFVNDRRVRRGTRGYDFVDKESLLVCREAGLSGAVDVICRAQNVIGIDTRQAMVDMSSITSPVDPPVSIPAQSGQPPKITGEFEFQGLNATCVRIHCPAMSREQFQISWTLGTESLTSGIRRGGLEVDKDGELTACLAANRLKELELVCRASNRFGFVAQKETISLLGLLRATWVPPVQPITTTRRPPVLTPAHTASATQPSIPAIPPRILQPKESVVIRSTCILVLCQVEGEPKPNIRWTLDGEKVPMDRSLKSDFTVTMDGALQVCNLNAKRHSGLYKCTASNVAGVTGQSQHIDIAGYIRRIQQNTPKPCPDAQEDSALKRQVEALQAQLEHLNSQLVLARKHRLDAKQREEVCQKTLSDLRRIVKKV